ncbi:methyl-accepting chemotaxis protein [Vibrio lamellibrachiae]|uniref:methyl-accepting chemotaxis protein n=1 Tax=Vibrio lamellibrachiae TaxID=2910253 RepID=UPI003D1244BE
MNKLSIKQKVMFLVGIFVIMLLINSYIAISGLNKVAEGTHSITSIDMHMTEIATKLTEHQLQQEIAFEQAYRAMLLLDIEDQAFQEEQVAIEHFTSYGAQAEKNLVDLENFVSEHRQSDHISPFLIEAMNKFDALLVKIRQHHFEWQEQAVLLLEELAIRNVHEAELMTPGVEALAKELSHEVIELLENIEEVSAHHVIKIEEYEHQLVRNLIITVCITLLVSLPFSYLTIRSLATSVASAQNSIRIFSKGDLTHQFQTVAKDEVADIVEDLQYMQNGLRRVVGDIANAHGTLDTTSHSLNDLIQITNETVQEQTNDTKEVASNLNEIGIAAREVTTLTSDTLDQTSKTKQIVVNTNQSMEQAIGKFSLVNETINSTQKLVNQLEADSNSIVSVLDVIKGIAEQTNLLALNAAIEAARAGDQGRGFAVVADEVRTLAQRTQDSTGEIEEMLNNFKRISGEVSTSISQCVTHANEGVSAGGETMDQIQSLVSSVDLINDRNHQIASSAEEQTSVLEGIGERINRIDQMASNNMDSVNNISSLIDSLSDASNTLSSALGEFKT